MDMSDYPDMFIEGDRFDGYIVVGDKAVAEDIIAASDIALSIQKLGINVKSTKLSNEISDIYAQNLIVIGSPCNNPISSELMDNPSDCSADIDVNIGIIRFTNKKGHYQLLVTASSYWGIRNAANVLANFQDYNFKGTQIEVTKNSQGEFELEYSNLVKKDLSDFPEMFIKKGSLNSLIVVGDEAPSSDVIAQTNLALFFGKYLEKPVSGYTKLASEVATLDQNLILIGSACHNQLSSKIMGEPEPCDKGLEEGEAVIRLFEDNANVYGVIMSGSDKGIQEAVNVLTNYEDYSLSGEKFVVTIDEEETREEEEQAEAKEATDAEKEKQKIIEDLNKKISEQKEDGNGTDEEQEIKQEPEEPQPAPKEKSNFFKKIVEWFKSLWAK
ncbi:hypothetical protein KY347_02430 [Candidatus Woesearchaeota archaeon]|nr:hypothetical protein [Candidatus Woesearchaeota archaeon]